MSFTPVTLTRPGGPVAGMHQEGRCAAPVEPRSGRKIRGWLDWS